MGFLPKYGIDSEFWFGHLRFSHWTSYFLFSLDFVFCFFKKHTFDIVIAVVLISSFLIYLPDMPDISLCVCVYIYTHVTDISLTFELM